MPITTTPEGELVITLANLQNRIQKRLGGALSLHGISFTEYLVLRRLRQAPGNKLRRIDLAQSVGLSASGVTRLLNPMQKIGLVKKEEAARDARVSLVALTEAGGKIMEDADVSFNQAAQELLAPLGDEARAALSGITDALTPAAQAATR